MINLAKRYCKDYGYKFESINSRDNLFIASVTGQRKVSKIPSLKNYENWDTIKHRSAFVFQIMPDGDITCIYNYLGGKYHKLNTRFVFTSLIINEIRDCIL